MSRLDLKKIEQVGIWLWRMLITALVCAVFSYQATILKEARSNYNYVRPLIENTSKAVTENKSQPEIPDENNEEFQASCIEPYNIIEHPDEVIAFMEALDPYINSDPWKLEFLGILLLADRDAARNYLELQFSNGYPRN